MLDTNYVHEDTIRKCSDMIEDMLQSLDTARNSTDFIFQLNVCCCIQHIISLRNSRVRIPISSSALKDCAVFVNQVLSDNTLPDDIKHNFEVIQSMLYHCCGYSKVKFSGR